MSFDWNGYLTIAKKLKVSTDAATQNNNTEALQRTAVSRAYYAMYHLAEDFAKANFGYVPSQNGHNQYHSDIRTEYKKQSNNPSHQEVGKILFQLHKARRDCDYEADGIGNVKSLLGSAIIQADKVKAILNS